MIQILLVNLHVLEEVVRLVKKDWIQECEKWWSIADYHLLSTTQTITCPHCDHKETPIEIINKQLK